MTFVLTVRCRHGFGGGESGPSELVVAEKTLAGVLPLRCLRRGLDDELGLVLAALLLLGVLLSPLLQDREIHRCCRAFARDGDCPGGLGLAAVGVADTSCVLFFEDENENGNENENKNENVNDNDSESQ